MNFMERKLSNQKEKSDISFRSRMAISNEKLSIQAKERWYNTKHVTKRKLL